MPPSWQQAFCFFACLPGREHITLINQRNATPPYLSPAANTVANKFPRILEKKTETYERN
jgi:hypothetical protein